MHIIALVCPQYKSSDFPNDKNLVIMSSLALNYYRLVKFVPLCRHTGINNWLLVFLPMFIFLPMFYMKNIFTECWNRHFRGSRKQNFLGSPTMVRKPLQNSLQNCFCVDFVIQWWYLREFLETKSCKSLNLFFYHYQFSSMSQRGNRKLQKEYYAIKVCANLITCLNQLSLIFSLVLEHQVNLSYQGKMPFFNILGASLEF